jgi:hypothetical protein
MLIRLLLLVLINYYLLTKYVPLFFRHPVYVQFRRNTFHVLCDV